MQTLSSAPVDDLPLGTAGLGLISVPKPCDILAERIQQHTYQGIYPPGTALPPEREPLPRNTNSKIQKTDLRRMALDLPPASRKT